MFLLTANGVQPRRPVTENEWMRARWSSDGSLVLSTSKGLAFSPRSCQNEQHTYHRLQRATPPDSCVVVAAGRTDHSTDHFTPTQHQQSHHPDKQVHPTWAHQSRDEEDTMTDHVLQRLFDVPLLNGIGARASPWIGTL